MSLSRYHEKRDFKKTPEPRGSVAASGENLAFFIQKHHASHLHYDFRLELDGTLKSWAIPKGPSLDSKDKRLAVHVEDHPVDYGLFEGDIPPGQYGAGHVIVWDTGYWLPVGDAAEGLRKGNLKFDLVGLKLHGRWALVRMGKANQDGARGKENWLLIKENDDAARRGKQADVTALLPDSVLDQIKKPGSRTRAARTSRANGKTGGHAQKDATDAVDEGEQTSKAGARTVGDSGKTRPAKKTAARSTAAAVAKSGSKPGASSGADSDTSTKIRSARASGVRATRKKSSPADTGDIATLGGMEAKMPAMIKPQLATLAEKAPAGEDWLCEVKFDGYRALCRIEHGKARLYSRNAHDWSAKWKPLAEAAGALPVEQAWLDGEVVAIDEHGNISFQALQNNVRNNQSERLAYYLFDLPYLNGHDLRAVPLVERRRLLETLLADAGEDGPLLFSQHIAGDTKEIFSHACLHGLEGIIAKRADAPYASARNASWLKVKCQQRQEFVIGGYTDPAGARDKFGALLLGLFDEEGELHFAGRVGTGFDAALLHSLHARFGKLTRKTCPFAEQPPRLGEPALHWLSPKLVAEVKFAQWTESGVIRHASFVGLREDKPATDIRREQAVPLKKLAAMEEQEEEEKRTGGEKEGDDAAQEDDSGVKRRHTTQGKKAGEKKATALAAVTTKRSAGKSSKQEASVAGVHLTHPARVLYADIGLTKLDLARYYEEIADWILPHLQKRPMTLVRCPQGGSDCFFQKHANATTSDAIEHIAVPSSKGGSATYMTANALPSLIGMVQMGVLELHTWGAHEGKLEQPDRIIFDLDPAPGLEWNNVTEAAQLIRALLDELGLESFVKTTGGKGLHVVTPIVPQHPWDEIKAFSRAIAEHLEQQMPQRFTANMAKAKRGGKIFVDYLRNGSEATAVAAYSTRARPGAPVSVPVEWDELEGELRSDSFNVLSLPQRLHSLKHDPWQRYFALKQKITARMLKTFSS